MSDLLNVTFTLPDDQAEDGQTYLTQHVTHGWQEEADGSGRTRFTLYLDDNPSGRELARAIEARWPEAGVQVAGKDAEDWGRAWMEFFVPLECGQRFEILPPWLAGEAHPGLTPVIIEPKMAFGTGHHPTTALCMEGLAELVRDPAAWSGRRFLDLGTGSGILGIALCKLGMTGLGLDIDPLAIECALDNAVLNGVSRSLDFAVGSIDAVAPGETFDLIVANILSGPLIGMAPAIVSHLIPGGALVLSGLLEEQVPAVAEAYAALGLPEPQRRVQGEWAALLYT